jgi:hypothetical protein
MQQQTLAEVTFEQYRKPTRRERFLDEMNRVVPWTDLVAAIEPVYPKAEGPRASAGGRRTDAAPPLSAAVVQPIRSGRGGGPVRLARHAAVRGD